MPFRALFLSVLVAPLASAQPITTDRPDFTESTTAVGVSRVQLEAGATLAFDAPRDGSSTAALSGPEALFRVGLVRGAEARIVLPDLASELKQALGETAFSGGSLGAKIELPAAGAFATAAILT